MKTEVTAGISRAVQIVAAVASATMLCAMVPTTRKDNRYPWLEPYPMGGAQVESVSRRIPPPRGFIRTRLYAGSFGTWLRGLPLKPADHPVTLFNGALKCNQGAHAAVIDIDTGRRDLQQCADAVIRLRAEYLFAAGRAGDIAYNFTSGDRADYLRWRLGDRPVVGRSSVTWRRVAGFDGSYRGFRSYLDIVFTYAGTSSLARELTPVRDPAAIEPGDVFVQGGFPGHAAIVLDVAVNPATGRKIFLLAQSFMPAQEVHVLRNPSDASLSPWYSTSAVSSDLITPEWTFKPEHLRAWPRR